VSAPDVSAIVVAWNAGAALDRCVNSLRVSARHAGTDLQLVIVDNASEDDSVDALTLADNDVCIRNPTNAGYGVAAAQGMTRAAAAWILLVNPDVVVASEFFATLITVARRVDESVATLVPELRYASQRGRINSRGITVDDVGVPAEIDSGAVASGSETSHEVLGGSSGCCLLRSSAVRELGGPEPIFFAYLEDVDLALRLQRAGYRALFVADAVAWHEGSASAGEGSSLKTFLVARNRRLLFRLDGPHTLRARLWRMPIEIGHAVVSSTHGARSAPWLGRLDALRLRRYTRFVRRSRSAYDPHVAVPRLTPRATLRETLRRKRAVIRSVRR
jgi:GT2 family glycosyltransferase